VSVTGPLSEILPHSSGHDGQGRLTIAGCALADVTRVAGTPALVLDEDELRATAREYRTAFASRWPDSFVYFASKALSCSGVIRVFAEEGLGCDVASGGELSLALRGGFEPARIYFHGNAKSQDELRKALAAGVGHVVLDSFDELERLERLTAELGRRQEVLIRVNPDVVGETHQAISTGQADSKFGFSIADARRAVERLRAGSPASRGQGTGHLDLVGLHVHIGSQLFELEPFRAAVRAIAPLGEFGVYNLGGGLGAAYTASQHPPAVVDYVEAVVGAAHELLGPGGRLLLEPGRALVANSAVTLYTIETVKRNVSTWVAVDGGMSDNLRPMLYGSEYEAMIADRALAAATERCQVAGKHCESGDVIVRDAPLPDPRPGDVLATPATGAYGYSLANNYNGVPRAPVILCREGDARVVVRRETYDDLTRRDVG